MSTDATCCLWTSVECLGAHWAQSCAVSPPVNLRRGIVKKILTTNQPTQDGQHRLLLGRHYRLYFYLVQAIPALRAEMHRSIFAPCSTGLDLRTVIPACYYSCFRQCLLPAYPGDCLLSIGCWTDRRHE